MGICTPYVDTSVGRVTVHTSGTRPTGASAYAGKHIFESDTGRTLMWDGTGWVIMNEPWLAYTPTWTNLTAGNGTSDFRYHRSDGCCEIEGIFTLGSTSSVAGLIGMSVPSGTGPTSASGPLIGFQAWIADASPVATYPAIPFVGATTRLDFYTYNAAAAAAATLVASGAASPMAAWATSDQIRIGARWRMANRYA